MESISETGHARNIANFDDLIQHLKLLGDLYKPTIAPLQISTLGQLHLKAETTITEMDTALNAYSRAVEENAAAHRPLSDIVTRSLTVFKALLDNSEEIESADRLARMIRSFIGPPADDRDTLAEEEVIKKIISRSQESYDMINENLALYIDALAVNKAYKPVEGKLSVEGLRALLQDLKSKSDKVSSLNIKLITARTNRDKALYTPKTGLVAIGKRVIKYVQDAIAEDNEHRAYILTIQFTEA